MDAAKKVVLTAYEELPRRRPGSCITTSSTAAPAKTHAAVGGGYFISKDSKLAHDF